MTQYEELYDKNQLLCVWYVEVILIQNILCRTRNDPAECVENVWHV